MNKNKRAFSLWILIQNNMKWYSFEMQQELL